MERQERLHEYYKLPYLLVNMQLDDAHPHLNQLIRRAQARHFQFAANRHLAKQKHLFQKRKLQREGEEFKNIQVTYSEHIDCEELMADLKLEDLNATRNLVDMLEADEEIAAKIDDLKTKQCKTD